MGDIDPTFVLNCKGGGIIRGTDIFLDLDKVEGW